MISAYGVKANGERNDGINIEAPEGTPIKAAEGGEVIYAGNELKGFGNLVLVKHPSGFVSAYAHAGEILVQARRHDHARPDGRQGRRHRQRNAPAAALRTAPGQQANRPAAVSARLRIGGLRIG